MKEVRQRDHAIVRHLHCAEVRLAVAAVKSRRRRQAGEGVEHGGLAASGESDESNLHGVSLQAPPVQQAKSMRRALLLFALTLNCLGCAATMPASQRDRSAKDSPAQSCESLTSRYVRRYLT